MIAYFTISVANHFYILHSLLMCLLGQLNSVLCGFTDYMAHQR